MLPPEIWPIARVDARPLEREQCISDSMRRSTTHRG